MGEIVTAIRKEYKYYEKYDNVIRKLKAQQEVKSSKVMIIEIVD